jgi:GT2 family glycosyltransferase
VTITTRNRCRELRRTCQVLSALDPAPEEVLICADGCTDDTEAMVRAEFPGFRLFVNRPPRGSVGSRDFLIREATADLIVSFDDDSHPVGTDFLGRLREAFARYPEAAVISFAQRTDEYPETLRRQDWGPGRFVASYANSAAALRRDVYLRLDGYDPRFFHMYEEPDFALQCYAAGHAVWFEPTLVVRHYYTGTSRSNVRAHGRHARNEQWSVWRRCPMPFCLLVSCLRALSQFRYACRQGPAWACREPAWWLAALRGLPEYLALRRPVSWRAYLRWMRLGRRATGPSKAIA